MVLICSSCLQPPTVANSKLTFKASGRQAMLHFRHLLKPSSFWLFSDSQNALSSGIMSNAEGAIFSSTYTKDSSACNAIQYVIYTTVDKVIIYRKRGKCSIPHFALLKVEIKWNIQQLICCFNIHRNELYIREHIFMGSRLEATD